MEVIVIVGLTHDKDTGNLNKITKYRGKISAGFAPNEGTPKVNYPRAAGYFRMLKEVIKNQRIGTAQKIVPIKEWVINEPVQEALQKACGNNVQPKKIEFYSLYKDPRDIWESCLAWFSAGEGLICKSQGRGTKAKNLKVDGDKREWVERECLYIDCPDYKSGKCKALGQMKVFPLIDLSPNPYRFETRSKNTILGIESSLVDLFVLAKAAHFIKELEAGKVLPFDGLFGAKLILMHRKTKSGGKEVFITDLMPSPEFTESVMEPLKRGLAAQSKTAKIVGAGGSVSLLEAAQERIIENSKNLELENIVAHDPVPLELADQQGIAVDFGGDGGEEIVETDEGDTVVETSENKNNVPEGLNKMASETLLDDTLSPPKDKE